MVTDSEPPHWRVEEAFETGSCEIGILRPKQEWKSVARLTGIVGAHESKSTTTTLPSRATPSRVDGFTEVGWHLAPVLVLAVLTAGLMFVRGQLRAVVAGRQSRHRHAVAGAGGAVPSVLHDGTVAAAAQAARATSRRCVMRRTASPSRCPQADVWFELAVLAGFALVTLGRVTWRLPWRED